MFAIGLVLFAWSFIWAKTSSNTRIYILKDYRWYDALAALFFYVGTALMVVSVSIKLWTLLP